jgi:hypothetical protein
MIGYKTEQPYVVSKRVISTVKRFLSDRKLHLAIQFGFTWPNCHATDIPPKSCRYYYLTPVSVEEAFKCGSLKLSNRGVKGLTIKDIWGEIKPHTIQLKYSKDKLKANVIKALQSETSVGKLISIANDLGIEIDINERKELP